MLRVYARVNDGLAGAIVAIASALMMIIVLAPFVAAVVRYWTGQGYDWLAELPPQLLPWVVFPLVGVLLRKERHIAVDVVPHFLDPRRLRWLRAVVMAISLGGCLLFAVFGVAAVRFFARLGQISTTEIEFPLWWLYVSYPLGFALAANFCLEALLRNLAGVAEPASSEPELQGLIE